VRVQPAVMIVIGEAVRGRRSSSGRSWWWRWIMVARANDGGCVHACVGSTSSSEQRACMCVPHVE
jgi:hypothetical protein